MEARAPKTYGNALMVVRGCARMVGRTEASAPQVLSLKMSFSSKQQLEMNFPISLNDVKTLSQICAQVLLNHIR